MNVPVFDLAQSCVTKELRRAQNFVFSGTKRLSLLKHQKLTKLIYIFFHYLGNSTDGFLPLSHHKL